MIRILIINMNCFCDDLINDFVVRFITWSKIKPQVDVFVCFVFGKGAVSFLYRRVFVFVFEFLFG